MRRYLIPSLLLAGIALSGCSPETQTSEATASEMDSPQSGAIEMCQNNLASQLKDPGSAQFQDVQAFEGIGWLVTGEMNAKNSMGGYVGFAPFRCELSKSATTGEIDSVTASWEGE